MTTQCTTNMLQYLHPAVHVTSRKKLLTTAQSLFTAHIKLFYRKVM